MWRWLFSSGDLAHPTFFPLTLICVGRLSLVVNHVFSLEKTCTGAEICIFGLKPTSPVFYLKIRLKCLSGFMSSMREKSLQKLPHA